MSTVVGIDAGGTKLAAARVDTATGALTERRVIATPTAAGGSAVLEACLSLARTLGPGATGIGVPEVVDGTGRIRSAANWDWRDVDLSTAFSAVGSVHVVSDVYAAALAEARYGAGRDAGSFLYVSVGTGISSTLVINGRPWAGADGRAILLGAPLVEDVASGPALARVAGATSAEAAFADPAATSVVAAAAAALGLELARIVHATDPGLIVLGGGLGLVARYRALVAAAIASTIDSTYAVMPTVVPAALGADAGVIGAALAAG